MAFQHFKKTSSSWRGSARASHSRRLSEEKPKEDIMDAALGELLATFSLAGSELEHGSQQLENEIQACEDVASYTLLNQETNILVPGKCISSYTRSACLHSGKGRPPAWTPLEEPRRLLEDSGEYLRDPNAARFPKYPAEPAVSAIFSRHPTFDTSGVDLFACTSTLGNLCRWARGYEKPCRFNIDCVGSTVFFVRKEISPATLIPDVRGFGHSFPESYTTWEDRDDCLSHQRIIRYDLGGLSCLVRGEIDGYIPDNAQPGPTGSSFANSPQTLSSSSQDTSLENDTLLNILHSPSPPHPIPQSSIFDLKTRSMKRHPAPLDDIIPRLWLAQIPTLILAYHHSGLFTDIEVRDSQLLIREWQHENASSLRIFVHTLKKIIDIAKEHEGEGGLEAVIHGPQKLEIRKRSPGETDYGTLPEALMARWKSQAQDESTTAQPKRNSSSDTSSDKEPDVESDGQEIYRNYAAAEDDNDLEGYHSFDEYGDDDDDSVKDYTACSLEDCGYCGHCKY
ncbi:MAG: hypothetical protein Q9227_005169 [Pyrenula ochraceoflavens]